MRIIAGKHRGAKLVTPQGENTRPTLDRAKETLFNIINFDILDASCLDLFAGSGQIGLELLSRGAKHCVFVDSALQAVQCIKTNINKLNEQSNSQVINSDAISALNALRGRQFDIVYIDPPYDSDMYSKCLSFIANSNLLSDSGFVVCETDNIANLPQSVSVLELVKSKKVGSVYFVWYTKGVD